MSLANPSWAALLLALGLAACEPAATPDASDGNDEEDGDGNGDEGDGSDGDGSDGDGNDGDDDGLGSDDGAEPGEIGSENVPPSQDPPGGLSPEDVPQFVSLGWDDNAYSGLEGSAGTGGMTWAVEMLKARKNPEGSGNAATYDGEQTTNSFYLTSTYGEQWNSESNTYVKRAWRNAYDAGNEIGNHTKSHLSGTAYSADQWRTELQACIDLVTMPFDPNEMNTSPDPTKGVGLPREEMFGYRTPFLQYNDETFGVVKELDFWYDCSIEEGFEYDQDGSNYFWPYTLDNGSPGHDILVEWGTHAATLTPRPGLWELPVYAVIVPPDEECENYGVEPGLRSRLQAVQSWFDVGSGKITGFDYNLWVSFKMNKAEFLATLKYTLDQRLKGNRAPFLLGTHTDYYSSKYTAAPNASVEERQEAIEEFLDYALSKPVVRVVSHKKVLDWIRRHVD
jgi:hypothetical protein